VVTFIDLAGQQPFTPAPGVSMSACWGTGLMANRVEMLPGSEIPLHSHPEEQLGVIIEGELILDVDGEPHPLGPGQAYVVASGFRHGGRAGADGCVLIDVFGPVRADYRDAQLAASSSG
jgi:quercetin dioxygenase-like cupin family protein